ncbi:hypothetical protein [Methylocella silvestris]|nr:hypothetical protein [Methylocella silvestris]
MSNPTGEIAKKAAALAFMRARPQDLAEFVLAGDCSMSAALPLLASLAGLISLLIGAMASRARLTAQPAALHRRGNRLN